MARGRGLMERGRWDEAEAAFDELVRSSAVQRFELDRSSADFTSPADRPEKAVADFAVAIRHRAG